MRVISLKRFFFIIVMAVFFPATISFAGVNLDLTHKLTLDSAPLDVVATPDGKYFVVLTENGDISVFDQEGALQNKRHVGSEADQIELDPKNNRLFVTSRVKKTIQVIFLDFFFVINTAGAPARGPSDAPLVLAVFSDFQ